MILSALLFAALTLPVASAAAPNTGAVSAPLLVDPLPGNPHLLGLTVTASRLPGDPFVMPPMTTVLGPEELRRLPKDQTPNLLLGQPGILIQKSNHGGGSPFIHGMTGKQILILVDGVRMNNSLYRFGPHQYLNTIDPYSIDRIEIIRGPASVLYGSDALGGVINIVTKSPQAGALRPGAALGAGSADASLRARFQIDGSVEDLGLLGGVTGHRFQNLRAGGDVGVQANTGYDAAAADLKLTHDLNERVRLTAATQIVRQFDVPKSNETLLGGKLKYDYEPQFRWLTYAQVQASDLGALADAMVLSASFQNHEEGERIINAPGAPERNEHNDARSFGSFIHFVKQLGWGNTLGVGGDWYTDRINSEASETGTTATRAARATFPDGARYESYGVYVQDEWRIFDSLRLMLGGRHSRFQAGGAVPAMSGAPAQLDLDVEDLTGSSGLTWEFVDGLFVAGQAAQGFRAPNMEDFFGKVDFQQEIPNTDLQPEKSIDYEAGLKIRRWGLRGEAYYFRSNYRDLIDRTTVNADVDGDGITEQVAQRRNIGRARIHGFEGALTYALRRVETFATYSWTFGDQLGKVGGDWETVSPLRRMPPRQGSVGARWLLRGDHFAGADVQWALRQDRLAAGDKSDPRIGPEGTPGYAVLNLRSGWQLGELGRLNLGVENVFDQQYKGHGSGIWYAGRNVYAEYSIGL